jgi:predicted transcriptional regulator
MNRANYRPRHPGNHSNGGGKLKEWRHRGHVPARSFANLVPCSERTIYRWEGGTAQPTLDQAIRIQDITHGAVKPADWSRQQPRGRQ